MKERKILKYEKFMHAAPIIVWVGTGTVGIAFKIFSPTFFNYWIAPMPINCAAYDAIGDNQVQRDILLQSFNGLYSTLQSGPCYVNYI